jgi:hypothetical protein
MTALPDGSKCSFASCKFRFLAAARLVLPALATLLPLAEHNSQ